MSTFVGVNAHSYEASAMDMHDNIDPRTGSARIRCHFTILGAFANSVGWRGERDSFAADLRCTAHCHTHRTYVAFNDTLHHRSEVATVSVSLHANEDLPWQFRVTQQTQLRGVAIKRMFLPDTGGRRQKERDVRPWK